MVPAIVHCPPALKPGVKAEVVVALTEKSGSPKLLFVKAPNVIVWSPFNTWMVAVAEPPRIESKSSVPPS